MKASQYRTYRERRAFGDKVLPEVQGIIKKYQRYLNARFCNGRTLVASDKLDKECGTDLLFINDLVLSIAVRIRAYSKIPYSNEITIRDYVDHIENQTEYNKIINGFGNVLFYGFMNKFGTGLECWGMYDLDVFREYHQQVRGSRICPVDGDHFWVYRIDSFPETFTILRMGL